MPVRLDESRTMNQVMTKWAVKAESIARKPGGGDEHSAIIERISW
jgi:hypothetical protein